MKSVRTGSKTPLIQQQFLHTDNTKAIQLAVTFSSPKHLLILKLSFLLFWWSVCRQENVLHVNTANLKSQVSEAPVSSSLLRDWLGVMSTENVKPEMFEELERELDLTYLPLP